jgi:ketosteroid isomerase-like protein
MTPALKQESSRLQTVRRYLQCLHAGDTEGLVASFARHGLVVSPLLGTMAARPFFTRLAQSTTRSVITPLDLFESAERVAAYFRYDWTLSDGTVVSFTCVDVFEFDDDARITLLNIVYDAQPIRGLVGDEFA